MSGIVLCDKEGKTFTINENANDILQGVLLELENDNLGAFRKSLVDDNVLQEQIIPCLIAVKDSNNIIPITIVRLLSKMTDPFPVMFSKSQNKSLNESFRNYLSSIKELLNDPLVTWAILKLIKSLAATNPSPTDNNGGTLKDCLTLLRNLFTIPDLHPDNSVAGIIAHLQKPSRHNCLVWYLLYQSFDSLFIDLIHKRFWCEPLVDIIRLMFKDTKPETMKKLVKEWMESSSSSSSDNTYPISADDDSSFTDSGGETYKQKPKKKSPISGSPEGRPARPEEPFDPQPSCSRTDKEQVLDNPRVKMDCEPSNPSRQLANLSRITCQRISNSSSMSENSTTDCRELKQGNKRKVQDILANLTSGISTSNEPNPKRRKPSGEQDQEQKKKLLLPRGKRRKNNKDGAKFNSNSGIDVSENVSSDSESEEEKWRVRAGDYSDTSGYYSAFLYQNQLNNVKRALEKNVSNSLKENRERRKKIMEIRSKTNRLKSRTLDLDVLQIAIEEDLNEVLREFVVDFLLKGYSILLTDIHQHLLRLQMGSELNLQYKKNYAWLIYYFLPLASQMEISIQQIPMNFEVVHYLTGETIFCILKILSTSIDVCVDEFEVIKEFVKAQRHFFETLNHYDKTDMTKVDSDHHHLILLQVVHTKNVRQLFVLLIRLASLCGKLTPEYLSNLIVGNHVHLITIQETLVNPSDVEFDMSSHIKQFSSVEMMLPFGHMLVKFRENSDEVNDCIFTMMHHVAGDLNCPQALDFEPIAETLQQLVVTEMQVCDDWKDLIEYMINYFRMKDRKGTFKGASCISLSSHTKGTVQTISIKSESSTKSEKKQSSPENKASSPENNQYSPNCATNQNTTNLSQPSSSKRSKTAKKDQANTATSDKDGKQEKMVNYVKETETGGKDENEADECRENGEIMANSASPASDVESASLIAFPSPSHGQPPSNKSGDQSPQQQSSVLLDTDKRELIKSLVEILRRDGQSNAVSWLQESLLDAWKVQLTMATVPTSEFNLVSVSTSNQLPLEPLASYHIHCGEDIPLVAWSEELCTSLRNTVFLQLLSQMGFHVGDNPTLLFPAIPRSWTTNDLLEQAMSLGTANSNQIECNMLPGQIL